MTRRTEPSRVCRLWRLLCGIVGKVYAERDRQVEESLLRSMCQAIARGPDDEGIYRQGPAGLEMRGLKVLDLEAGGLEVRRIYREVSGRQEI